LASLAFAFVITGVRFGEERWWGYGLIGGLTKTIKIKIIAKMMIAVSA